MPAPLTIRDLAPDEYDAIGRIMVRAYAALDGFPKPDEQPAYYELLAHIGRFAERPEARVLVALTADGTLAGGVVYFGDMAQYGAGGPATTGVANASGIRLLGVDPDCRGRGVGRALTEACIAVAREHGHRAVLLHSTQAMRVAWRMYEGMGFRRAPEMDFDWQAVRVYGFRLELQTG